jgi:hypothetical protein
MPEILTFFSAWGTIKSSKPTTSKGYVFLEYESKQIASTLIEKSKKEPIHIGGRLITVDERRKSRSRKADKGDRTRKDAKSTANFVSPPLPGNSNASSTPSTQNNTAISPKDTTRKHREPKANNSHTNKNPAPPKKDLQQQS